MAPRSARQFRRDLRRLPQIECFNSQRCLAATFCKGLEIDRSPAFNSWLIGQRRRFRGYHAALLEQLARSISDDSVFGYVETWLQLAPFDRRVHETLFKLLASRGRLHEGEEHLAATVRLFDNEDLDATPLRDMWRAAKRTRRTCCLQKLLLPLRRHKQRTVVTTFWRPDAHRSP